MFGGLSIKGDTSSSKASAEVETPPPSSSASVASSGFSFLQGSVGGGDVPTITNDNTTRDITNNGGASQPPQQSAGEGVSSAFSFLASTDAPIESMSMACALPASSSSSSGFSFLATPSSAPPAVEEEATNSSFGFLGGGNNGGVASMNRDAGSNGGSVGGYGGGGGADVGVTTSGFSFLSSPAKSTTSYPVAPPSTPMTTITQHEMNISPVIIQPATTSSNSSNHARADSSMSALTMATTMDVVAPTPMAVTDLLAASSTPSWSSSVPGLAIGGGIIGGGIAPKKIVKKKKGKSRVGVATSSFEAEHGGGGGVDIPDPAEMMTSMQQPSSAYDEGARRAPQSYEYSNDGGGGGESMNYPTTPMEGTTQPPYIEESPPMRIKAERAMCKADEFIREKQQEMQLRQRSAISSAAERAMHQRANSGGTGGGSAWKMTNDSSTNSSPSNNSMDETFQAAKAAAEEAKKLSDAQAAQHGSSKGKASLFGGFFNRGKIGGGGSSGSENIGSYSSHGGVLMPRASPTPPNLSSNGTATRDILRRGESGGSSSSGGAVGGSTGQALQTVNSGEISSYALEIPEYQVDVDATVDSIRRSEREEYELQLERQRRVDLERMEEERLVAVAAAERRAEEEARAEAQRIEAEKRRAPQEKVRLTLDRLAVRAREWIDNIARIREARAELVEKRAVAEKAERYAAQRAKFAEAQQAVAVEEEDFEAADRLGSVIEQHTKEKETQADVRRGIQSAIVKLDEEGMAASKAVVECFVETRSKLAEVQNEVDSRSKEEEVQSQMASMSKRLSSESERLANEVKNIERDEQALSDEQQELDDQIGEETKEFDDKCKVANSKLVAVNTIIVELRKQLAEAEAEGFDLSMEIKSYNHSIDNIRSKYSRQLGRLEKKSQSVKESRADWTSEKESIEKSKIAHEAMMVAHSEEMIARERIIDEIKVECEAARELEEVMSTAFETSARGMSNGDMGDDSSSADAEVLKYEAVVNEANQNVIAAEANISNLQEEVNTIIIRIPILEAEKKNAASKRDFKAAGQASKDIKDALARKEQCEAELAGEAMERKRSAKEDLENVTTILEGKKKIAEEREKVGGLREIDCLTEKILDLKLVLEKFASMGGDDSDDDCMNVSIVGAFVITSQITVLEKERRVLRERFGVLGDSEIVDVTSVHSGPSFESTSDSPPEIIIDATILERYDLLSNEINDLENSIEAAVNEEDFDKAAELEEQISILREEFENSGFASDAFLRALRDFEGTSNDGGEAQDEAAVASSSEKEIDEDILEKYTSLCSVLSNFEAKIEKAVNDELFDLADELDEKLQTVRSEIDSLGFSIEELEGALKDKSVNGGSNDQLENSNNHSGKHEDD